MNKELSKDQAVLRRIKIYNDSNEVVWFSKLANDFVDIPRDDLMKLLNKLYDLGMIDGEWKKFDGVWKRCFKIAPEVISYVESIEKYAGEKDE